MDRRHDQAADARAATARRTCIPDFGCRYELLTPIGHGAMGLVYRCYDRLTRREVALKHVRTPLRDATGLRADATREFRLLASLRHVNVISVRDFGFARDSREPFFTMDLVEPAENLLEAALSRPLVERGQLLVQLLRALLYLHRRGVLHRDLKPSNILVGPDGVQLVDFGLSVLRSHASEPSPSGSLAWMAPELLRGGTASDASDLYAVGVLAYEMFTGCHPYDTSTASTLYRGVLHGTFDQDRLRQAVSAPLAEHVASLLAPEPSARPADIAAMIQTVADALGFDAPVETHDTRDSFLRGAEFVGRAREAAQLAALLEDAIDTAGGTVLLLGESGVGKSRLVDELRVDAMVCDVCVLSGQAVDGGGAPWQLWLGIFRQLLIDAVDLDATAAHVLTSLLPETSEADGRGRASPGGCLMRDAVHAAVLAAVESLPGPALFVLEDVHWAHAESLALLEAVARAAPDAPLLVVATCRADEIPDALHATDHECIALGRLARHEVVALSTSMLGSPGADDGLVDRLMVETEGNPFFLVEIVRSMAEHAGRLTDIVDAPPPDPLVPVGIQRVAWRQLARLGAAAGPLLDAAAVCGRLLDLAVLRRIDPGADLDAWLGQCAQAGVLEPAGDDWWFAHDKIREAIVEAMEPRRRRAAHLRVAVALEADHREPSARAAALAVHWRHAGDARAEAHYLGTAGQAAARVGADDEAIDALQRALHLTDVDGPAFAPGRAAELERAHWMTCLGRAWLRTGHLDEARRQLEASVELLGYPVARGHALTAVHGVAALLGARRALRAGDRQRVELALDAWDALVEVHHLSGRLRGMLYAALTCHRLADVVATDLDATARAAMSLSTVLLAVRQDRLADHFMRKAWRAVASGVDDHTHMRVGELTALMCLQRGQWALADEHLRTLAERGRRLGVWRNWEFANLGLLWSESYRGLCPVGWTAVLASATHRDDARLRAWTQLYMARQALEQGSDDEARTLVDAAERCLAHTRSHEDDARIMALRARLAARDGDPARAVSLARSLLTAFEHQSVFRPWLSPTSLCAEVLLDALEHASPHDPTAVAALRHDAALACRALDRIASRMPIARPSALRHRARLLALEGQRERADALWCRALAVAAGFEAWPEHAQTLYDQARLTGDCARRGARLEAAIVALVRHGQHSAADDARAML